jgi:hypothetical protein
VVGGREATVSIWTTARRLKGVRVPAAPHDLVVLRTRPIGETDLIRRDGNWYLYASVEAPETPLTDPVNGFLGVDLGIVNIATSSDGDRAAEPLSHASAAAAGAVAGQENILGAAVAQETAPQGGPLRR